jgi:hypothetical protein
MEHGVDGQSMDSVPYHVEEELSLGPGPVIILLLHMEEQSVKELI